MRVVLEPSPLPDSATVWIVPPPSLVLCWDAPPTASCGQVCTEDLEQAAAAHGELSALQGHPVWSGILYTVFPHHLLSSQLLLPDAHCRKGKPAEHCGGKMPRRFRPCQL